MKNIILILLFTLPIICNAQIDEVKNWIKKQYSQDYKQDTINPVKKDSVKIDLKSFEQVSNEIAAIKNCNFNAGIQLKKHTTNVVLSIGFTALSGIIIAVATTSPSYNQYNDTNGNTVNEKVNNTPLYVLSGICGMASITFSISAIFNINKAGKYLQQK